MSATAPLRHPGRAGQTEGRHAAAARGEQRVGRPVVVAGELHDAVAPGDAARQADGGHRRLRAGVHQPHPLARRNPLADGLRQLHLPRRRRAVRGPVARRPADRLDDLRMGVSEDHRAVALDEIEVLAALDVVDVGALGAGDDVRRAADRLEGPDRGVDAPRDGLTGASEQCKVGGHAGAGAHDRVAPCRGAGGRVAVRDHESRTVRASVSERGMSRQRARHVSANQRVR